MNLPKLEPKQTHLMDVSKGLQVDLLQVAGRKLQDPQDFNTKKLNMVRVDLSPKDIGMKLKFGVRMHFQHTIHGMKPDGSKDCSWKHIKTESIPTDRVIALPDLTHDTTAVETDNTELAEVKAQLAQLQEFVANEMAAKAKPTAKKGVKKTSPEDSSDEGDLEKELD